MLDNNKQKLDLLMSDYCISLSEGVSPTDIFFMEYKNTFLNIEANKDYTEYASHRLLANLVGMMRVINKTKGTQVVIDMSSAVIENINKYVVNIEQDFYNKYFQCIVLKSDDPYNAIDDKIKVLEDCYLGLTNLQDIIFDIEYHNLLLRYYLDKPEVYIDSIKTCSSKLKELMTSNIIPTYVL